MELEEALARIAELEGQVTALAAERDTASERAAELESGRAAFDARLAEAASARDAAELALSEANGTLGEAQALGLANLRRALLAEHAGQVVPELVTGESEETLLASVEVARQAYGRALDAARATIVSQTVPAGVPSARTVAASAGLTPLEMIESGLRR
jgi:hypothetical protein